MITKNKNERLSIALRKNLKKRKIFQKKTNQTIILNSFYLELDFQLNYFLY